MLDHTGHSIGPKNSSNCLGFSLYLVVPDTSLNVLNICAISVKSKRMVEYESKWGLGFL